MAGGEFRLWPLSSRNTQAQSNTDLGIRHLREQQEQRETREETATSDDDLELHISVADANMTDSEEMGFNADSPTPIDLDETISDDGDQDPALARNGYNDSVYDYVDLFRKLKLSEDFYPKFRSYIKEHREEEDVIAALRKGTDKSVKQVAAEFLKVYGENIWKLKGKNCHQDRSRYGEVLFDIKIDTDKLIPILDELWFQIRDNLYTDARPAAESVTPPPPAATKPRRFKPKWPAPFTSPPPLDVSQTTEEQDIALTFIKKVRKEVHNLPGLATRPK